MHLVRQKLIVLLMVSILFIASCSPATLAKQADNVSKYALKTKPLFQSLIDSGQIPAGSILARIDQISADAAVLATAFRENDHASALETTAKVIDVVERLIDEDTDLIKDPRVKSKVIAWLTAAEIALGIITDSFAEATHHHAIILSLLTQDQQKAIETIKKFRAKVRCRMAGTVKDGDKTYKAGQFAPMTMCKKYPDNTTVERVKPRH